jgi:transcriptional antiterminator NusG
MNVTDDEKAAEMIEELGSESEDESKTTSASTEENDVAEMENVISASDSDAADTAAEADNEAGASESNKQDIVADAASEADASDSNEEAAITVSKSEDDISEPDTIVQEDQPDPEEELASVEEELKALEVSESDNLEEEQPNPEEQDTAATPEEIVIDGDSEPAADSPEPEVSAQADPGIASQEEPVEEVESTTTEPTLSSLSDESTQPEGESLLDVASPENDDGRKWYVVHCYSGYENKVRHNLEQRIESMGMKNLIFDVVVPTEEEIEVKEGKRRTVERRVFPGYILINMILGEESWYVVRNTPGVTSFVGMGEEPTPLRPEEVSQIIQRMESDAPRIKVTFKQGERVRIVDGPFNDFRGTVNEIDMERAKVHVMVNFFGRDTPVELDFLQVEKS